MTVDEILESLGRKPKKYDLPYIQAKPLPETPAYWDDFLKSFVDYDDYLLFIKTYSPKESHNNEELINRALWNAEFLIGTLGLKLSRFNRLVKACPDILIRPTSDLKKTAQLFIEHFYIELKDITKLINKCPEILQFGIDALLDKVVGFCHVMQMSRYTIYELIHKYPYFLFHSEEEIQNYLTVVAKTFKCHQDDLRNAIYNYPKILEIPIESIIYKYNTVYAKGFTRLEMRRIFITYPYNMFEPAESILKKVDAIVEKENLTLKEAKTIIGDAPFCLPLKYPYDHFAYEKAYRMDRKFLNKWQYDFQYPHKNFLIKYLFARCTGIEMQFCKFVNADPHKIFSRYFYLRDKIGCKTDFSHDLYSQDYQFEKKYDVKMSEVLEKYPLTMDKIDTLFSDYNRKEKYMLYHFPINKPGNFYIPPLNYSREILQRVFQYEFTNKVSKNFIIDCAFYALGLTESERKFLKRTIPNKQLITTPNISDIYLVFRDFDFTLDETNWIILHNPAVLNYDSRALRNRLKMISCHYHPRFFCYSFPERI